MASSIFATQLQPFEENQSPSPIEERSVNPFDALRPARSRSPQRSGNGISNGPPSPINTTNTLHRTLSGDPDVPPPAWKRRPSVTSRTSSSNESRGLVQPGAPLGPGVRPYRSPSESSSHSHRGPPPSRRHPNLTMTSSVRMPLPPQMFLHESPNGSSTSLADDLPLPQPPFRRRTGNSSNRSSIISTSDMSGMTSEDLWQLDSEAVPDMSNPERKAAERPLDTVRRISKQSEQSWQTGLPFDVIWPAAPPPADEFGAPLKSKSYNNVSSLSRKPSSILGRKRTVRQGSVDAAQPGKSPYQQAKSDPSSPVALKADSTLLSSAHSSSTSLSSHPLTMNKSLALLNGRPPSAYYSRDFLSSLAPREGGYAVAAAMGNGLGFVGTNAAEERRRSSVYDGGHRSLSRAPVSKSAGMGRWSLDGGENFHPRGYGSSSPSVTSNLSVQYSSPDPSPPAEEIHIAPLPAGASPAASPSASPMTSPSVVPQARLDTDVPSLQPPSTLPINPSPLGRSVVDTRSPPPNSIPIPPIPAAVAPPTLSPRKSKKEMKKEAKAAEKAEANRLAREKAESARQVAIMRQQQREAAAKEKDEAKRKEREDKERRKAEKKAKSSKTLALAGAPAPPPALSHRLSSNFGRNPVSTGASAPVHANPNPAPMHRATQSQTMLSTAPPAQTRTPRLSMPLGSQAAVPPPTSAPMRDEPQSKPRNKLGFLGTIKKRLSVMEPLKLQSGSEASAPAHHQAAAPLPIQSAVQNPMFAPGAQQQGPVPATPPRQGPVVAPVAAAAIAPNRSAPNPVPSPGLPPRSSSFQHTSTPPTPILTKSISHETPDRGNSPSSLQRSRSSLVGPRPMRPSSGTHRPASFVSQRSANGVDVSPASASFVQASPSSFPFSNATSTSTSNSAPLMTPSTLESPGTGHHAQPPLSASSGLSQVNSHLSTSTQSNDRLTNSDIASPFESSRKSSMTSDGSKPLGLEGAEGSYKRESAVLGDDGDGDDDLLSPERDSSKSSNETIHPSEAVSFVAAH